MRTEAETIEDLGTVREVLECMILRDHINGEDTESLVWVADRLKPLVLEMEARHRRRASLDLVVHCTHRGRLARFLDLARRSLVW
jgi:hypothetical protein